MFLMDDGWSLKIIKDDEGILDLVNQLMRRHLMVDVYMECSDVKHGKKLANTLLLCQVSD